MTFLHEQIKPIKAFVNSSLIYGNFDTNHQEYTPCEIFTVTCVKDEVLTFNILIHGKFIYSDVPLHALKTHTPIFYEPEHPILELKDLLYHKCPSFNFSLHEFTFLKEKPLVAYFKDKKLYLTGKYLLSLDFFQDNSWLHMIELYNGQLAFLPNHKIIFQHEIPTMDWSFPDFKKLREKFEV